MSEIKRNICKSDDIKAKIWTTAQCRMVAERRLRSYGFWSNLLTAWYSLCLIGASIANYKKGEAAPFDESYLIFLSVAVFTLTLWIAGQGHGEVAARYKECYLRLQKLLVSPKAPINLSDEYYDLISAYDNHALRDYDDFLVQATVLRPGKVADSSGKSVCPTRVQILMFFGRRIIYALFWIALFSAPVVGYIWIA